MQRRELLGAAAAVMAGCATSRAEPKPELDLDGFYRRVDRGLASIGNPFQEVVPAVRFEPGERAFVEASLRTLLLTAAIQELPDSRRGDPELEKRVAAHRRDFELGLGGAEAILRMPPAERIRIEREVRRSPGLPERISDVLGRHARMAGVAGSGRFELRSMAQQVVWRMQHQPISLLFDDTLDRMQRVQVRLGGGSERSRTSLARALFAQEGEYDEAEEVEPEPDQRPAKPREERELGPREQTKQKRAGRVLLGGGLAVSGGLALGGLGVGLAFVSFGGGGPDFLPAVSITMCTIGGLAVVGGLITLIVGGVMRAREKREEWGDP